VNVEFTSEARDDLFEAADYYEDRETGLGARFRNEIHQVLQTVRSAPFLWRERAGGYRRVNCPVFPFYVAYLIRGNCVVVVAVAHGSRRPGFWHDRLG